MKTPEQPETKTPEYHKDCIRYNTEMAKVAGRLAKTLKDPEVTQWCASIERQHKYHAKKHRTSLNRLLRNKKRNDPTNQTVSPGPQTPADVEREKRELALADEIVTGLVESAITDDIVKTQVAFAAEKENVA